MAENTPDFEKIALDYQEACKSMQDPTAERTLLVHQLRMMYEAGKREAAKKSGW